MIGFVVQGHMILGAFDLNMTLYTLIIILYYFN